MYELGRWRIFGSFFSWRLLFTALDNFSVVTLFIFHEFLYTLIFIYANVNIINLFIVITLFSCVCIS